MDSVQTHYATQRDPSESPAQSPLRIPKRPMSILNLKAPSPERTSDDNLSEQGRDMQNLTRQEFQKRWQKKFGQTEGEDSIELESQRLGGKTGLEGGIALKSQMVDGAMGRLIPVKHTRGPLDDSSLSFSASKIDFSIPIMLPVLPLEEPSILLVPEVEIVPKDKKIPVKPKMPLASGRGLVIPAARTNPPKVATAGKPAVRPVAPSSPTKLAIATPKLAIPMPKFTMGSIPPSARMTSARRPTRSASTTISSPPKPRITRSISAQRALTTKPPVRYTKSKSVDIRVPVNFDESKSKRKYDEGNECSPAKRMRLNDVSPT
jgi:hypothetical protein